MVKNLKCVEKGLVSGLVIFLRELLAACLAWACLNQPDTKNLAKLLTLAIANSASTASSEWESMWAYACELAEQFRDEHDEKHFALTSIN